MTSKSTEALVQTGLEHLGRFAFYNRDNPFLSSRAALSLSANHRQLLTELLEGERNATEWLNEPQARQLLGSVKVGSVPRDVQLIAREGELVVGVESVHAFLHSQLFWWMVSILWTIVVAEDVDPLLGDGVIGFRFHESFLRNPANSGMMFGDQRRAHERWEKFPSRVAAENPGETLAANTLDIRAFYYSVDVHPAQIMSRFFKVKGERVPQTRAVRVLTSLLDALHFHFAERYAKVKPRQGDLATEGRCPLPVGLPSSQVLANMLMSLVIDDLGAAPTTLAAAAYADDIIVMTQSLLDLSEKPADYFHRLGLVEAEEPYPLCSTSTKGLAHLTLRLGKSGTSYSRHAGEEEKAGIAEEPKGGGEGNWDPYIDSEDSPDWGGKLRTVLRAPHRRDRVPRELRKEILGLLNDVRVGIPREEVSERFEKLVDELDHGLFVALRPYWAELIVIGLVASGPQIVSEFTELLRRVSESLKMPEGSTGDGRTALLLGLRASWIQSLAQALAVASGPEDQEQLKSELPKLDLGDKRVDTPAILRYARWIRKRRLIPAALVAVPLAEFSAWEGRLIGGNAFAEFLQWFLEEHPAGDPQGLARDVREAARFIDLHEACLAIHLWAGSPEGDWMEESFAILAAQPLISRDLIATLRDRANALLGEGDGQNHEIEDEENGGDGPYPLRVAMPSMRVPSDHLEALLADNRVRLGEIVTDSRSALQKVVLSAANDDVELLVLPEWSIVGQLLPWLMDTASRRQMAIIGGGAPEIVGGRYLNRLWTGLPLTDEAGHRACLVPPLDKRDSSVLTSRAGSRPLASSQPTRATR